MRVFLVAPDPVGLPHEVRQIETLGHEVVGTATSEAPGDANGAEAIVAWAARDTQKTGEVLDAALRLGQAASVPTLCVDADTAQEEALNDRQAVFIPPGRLADGLTACQRAIEKAKAQ